MYVYVYVYVYIYIRILFSLQKIYLDVSVMIDEGRMKGTTMVLIIISRSYVFMLFFVFVLFRYWNV